MFIMYSTIQNDTDTETLCRNVKNGIKMSEFFFLFKAIQHNIIVIQILDTLGVHIPKVKNVTLFDLSRT